MPRGPFRLVSAWLFDGPFRFWLSVVATQPDRRKAVRELLGLYDDVHAALERAAIAYDEGVHVKHRLTRYHDFFVERVRPGEHVLDVGSGKGELAYDLVVRGGVSVVGIDSDPQHVAFARSRFSHERLRFEEGDVLERLPAGEFDVVVLSSVIQYVEDRIGLLRRIVSGVAPRCVLLRVPVFARDWTVPLRQEVGLHPFSDPGHFVEYDAEALRVELSQAGLQLSDLVQAWGEIWATAEPL